MPNVGVAMMLKVGVASVQIKDLQHRCKFSDDLSPLCSYRYLEKTLFEGNKIVDKL